jgi:hypothetical protein
MNVEASKSRPPAAGTFGNYPRRGRQITGDKNGRFNDAQAKVPTLEEQVAQFKGFAVQDGENFDGNSRTAPMSAGAEASERTAAASQQPQPQGKRGSRHHQHAEAKGDKSGKVELTEDEESDALQAATDKKAPC